MDHHSPPFPKDAEIEAILAIVAGTARLTGQEFFQKLVRHLAEALKVEHAFVSVFVKRPLRVRTIAWWKKDRIAENIEYDLDGTPCHDVLTRGFCHYPERVQHQFPRDRDLLELGIESYLGAPLPRHTCGRSGEPSRTYHTQSRVGLLARDGAYYVGLDTPSALHPQTLLCDQLNGEPLPESHGGPLRLVITVKYGIKNIKWLGRIRFQEDPRADYWAERGYDWYSGL